MRRLLLQLPETVQRRALLLFEGQIYTLCERVCLDLLRRNRAEFKLAGLHPSSDQEVAGQEVAGQEASSDATCQSTSAGSVRASSDECAPAA